MEMHINTNLVPRICSFTYPYKLIVIDVRITPDATPECTRKGVNDQTEQEMASCITLVVAFKFVERHDC